MSERCPRCAALIQASSLWCGLCHYDLRPQPEPVAAVVADESSVPELSEPLLVGASTANSEATTPRGRGRHARPVEGETEDAVALPADEEFGVRPVRDPNAPAVVDSIDFSVLSGTGGASIDPNAARVQQWGSKLSSTGAKAVVMTVVVLAVAVMGVIGLSIAGIVL